MYICPTCKKRFKDEEQIVKHSLSCWKKNNPNHKTKPSQKGEDIVIRDIDNDVLDFFSLFQKEV